uniref:Uncharacterized protein n=1 Tax=Helianthus annuus TaxID=4232 RepID=A0A251UX63_HELAN
MVKTWWIRRWYFLYIRVFTMLPNFRKTCHDCFTDLLDLIQALNNSQTHHIRLSMPRLHL